MAGFAYTTVPGKIRYLLNKIRAVGIPARATVQWLKTIGFTSSSDASLLGVIKYIGFTDPGGVPSSVWSQYRGANHKKVLGAAIQQGYADLFAVYPDANLRSQDDLEHVFSTSTSGGKQVISKTISTFKTLVEQAEFTPVSDQTDLNLPSGPLHTPVANHPPARAASAPTPSLHIDIQVHISPDSTAEQIDLIFASMAKHLYGAKKDE